MVLKNLKLINMMTKKEISVIQLAKKTGMNRTKISGARSGVINLFVEEEESIAQALGVEAESIFRR